jgi:hypothetical protein
MQLGTLEVQMVCPASKKKGKSRNFDAFLKKDPPPKKQIKKEITQILLMLFTKNIEFSPNRYC